MFQTTQSWVVPGCTPNSIHSHLAVLAGSLARTRAQGRQGTRQTLTGRLVGTSTLTLANRNI